MNKYLKSGSQCDPPLILGTSYFQDKSLDLFRNVQTFVNKYIDEDENPSRIFVARVAMRPTLVLASNQFIRSYLAQDSDDFYNGLKDFFFGLFGSSIMFAEAQEAQAFRRILVPLFSDQAFAHYDDFLGDTLDYWMHQTLHMGQGSPLDMYQKFKHLSLSFNIRIFLGVNEREDPDLFQSISHWAHQHWHGIISVPLNVKVSFLMSSTYKKANEAKDRLLTIIEEKIQSRSCHFLSQFNDSGLDMELMKNHVLIFVCALIPKASASILSSLLETSEKWYPKYVDANGRISEEDVRITLLEILRLWPPFVGGFRVAKCDTAIEDYLVPKGHGVFYVSMMAHRDPLVFPYPEEFLPERWRTFNAKDRDKLFGFGAGIHACVGEQFMWKFFIQVAQTFIQTFSWDVTGMNGKRKMKYLPVSRPAEIKPLALHKRNLVSEPSTS